MKSDNAHIVEGIFIPLYEMNVVFNENSIKNILVNTKSTININNNRLLTKIKALVDVKKSLSREIALEKKKLPQNLMVVSYDLTNGETIGIYKSAKDVELRYGLCANNIIRVCLGERRHVNHIGWKFFDG